MTVAAQSNRYSYSGNGVTTAFAYSSLFLADADLVVVLASSAGVETVQTITTHYTVSGAGSPSGGTVTMLTAPASGETLVIYGDPAITQTLDLVENDQFPSASVESAFDRLTLVARRLYDMFSRTLRLSEGVVGVDTQITGTAASRANKYLAFNSSGNLTLASTVDPSSLTVSTFMETVLDDLDAASARATLGFTAGADIASATTVDLTAATGNTVVITGTTTTTALTMNAGQQMVLVANGAWPLTHHATNLNINGGASYTCSAGDRILAFKDGGGVVRVTVVPVSLIPSVVAQATAEAGTDTTPRLWTAERVAQAIAALASGGKIVQVVEGTPYTTAGSTATAIPLDSTIPQNTEGAELATVTITPTNASNRLRIECDLPFIDGSAGIFICAALFQDSTANALSLGVLTLNGANYAHNISFVHEMAAGTTSSTTFKLRCGPSSGTAYFNRRNSGETMGGVSACRIRVTEIKV